MMFHFYYLINFGNYQHKFSIQMFYSRMKANRVVFSVQQSHAIGFKSAPFYNHGNEFCRISLNVFVLGNVPPLVTSDGQAVGADWAAGGGPGGGPLEGAEGPGDHLPGRGHRAPGLRHQQQQPGGPGEPAAVVQGGEQPGWGHGLPHLQDRRQDQ